jgi:hypothetical protein
MDRLRPILMTALTTIFAMIIMAADGSDYGQLLQPLAIACIGGLTYATIVTLVIVPVVFDLVFRKVRGAERREAMRDETVDQIDADNVFDEASPELSAYIEESVCGEQFKLIKKYKSAKKNDIIDEDNNNKGGVS